MTHLRDAEFVDLLDGTLPPMRLAHLRSCDACRTTADDLRHTLAATSSDPLAAEPSPVFWEHFGGRVNRAIDAPPDSVWWWSAPRLAFGALATITALLLALTVITSRNTTPTAQADFSAAANAQEADDLDADGDWAVVRAAADDLNLDEAQAEGLVARPGTADRMALELTQAERAELIRLLQTEFKSGA